ncbi:hypothetical protein [Saccharomonospora saliphila]|uniref:hypothetical protein n=1 Tax=Saccharomonospora saliphila TaxID=369829 RepID=UPI000367D21F|nr:hypothetical protein [Saccharomonospora saliphila]
MFKKSAIVATAAAGLMAIGSPAFATTPGDTETDISDNTNQLGLVNVDDVLSNNQINVCDVLNPNVAVGVLGILGGGSATAADTGDTSCTNAAAESD